MKKLLVLLIIFNCQFFIVNCNAQPLSVSASVIQNVSCHGGDNGVATSNPSGGTPPYTYLWSPGSQTTQTATGLVAATYTIKVTDYLNNTATASVAVLQPAAPLMINAWAKTSAVCPASSDSLFASVSGGSAPYSYTWTGPIGDITSPTSQNTLCYPYGGAYVVTAVVDAWGCSATSSVAITTYPVPLVSIAGPINPIAPGRSDTLVASAVGATSYLWSNSSTNTTIIVSPSVPTTYSVTTTNMYGCYDTASYTIDTNTVGNGSSSSTAIRIVPGTNLTKISFSSLDSIVWFSFIPFTDSNAQIIAYSNWLSEPVPHVHRLTLYNSSMQTVMDEPMPDIVGANEIRLDISHLTIGNTYYVRASRCPASNLADINCNPSGGECNPTMRWDFQMCFRTVPVFVPDDSGSEPFSTQQLYYEDRGQIADMNDIPRFDLKAYTNNAYPGVYVSDSAVSFVYSEVDTGKSSEDTIQRVDMKLTGAYVQPPQPVFKMQEDSGAGYLNYFKEYAPNGVTKIEGYARLVYKNAYPNLDMEVYSNNSGTKLYFICNPAALGGSPGNPADIELQFTGANSVNVTGSGGLNVVTELGTLSFAPGYAYEDSAGTIVPTSWQPYFIAVNSNTVRFNTGSYNTSEPLIIRVDRGHSLDYNPSAIGNIEWSTYVGGNGKVLNKNYFTSVYTYNYNTYAAGFCQAASFPVTKGVVDSIYNSGGYGYDCIITQFTSNSRDWATYYGGSNDEIAYGIMADDDDKAVYVTGYTRSLDFPIKQPVGSYSQTHLNGTPLDTVDADAFILALNGMGTGTWWSTWFGGDNGRTGSAGEVGYDLALKSYTPPYNEPTELYVVGGQLTSMGSNEIPLMHENGAYNSSTGTAWIARFSLDSLYGLASPYHFGQQIWTTALGGPFPAPPLGNDDALFGCCVGNAGDLYVCGKSSESGYPTTPGTAQPSYNGAVNGNWNGVVTQFNSDDQMGWSTYYGGDASDYCEAITTDGSNVYITGSATSPEIATTIPLARPDAYAYYDSTNRAGSGGYGYVAFVAELNNNGSLLWGTYLGDANNFEGKGIAYDPVYHDVYVTGIAPSGSLPLPSPNAAGAFVQSSYGGGASDAFVAAFNPACEYVWGTYFGGNGQDYATAAATDGAGITQNGLVIVGSAASPKGFPIYNAFQDTNYGGQDGFITYFNTAPVPVTGIDVVTKAENGITAYPNPSTNNIMLEVQLTVAGNVTYTLYNLVGEIVYQENAAEPAGVVNREMDLSGLAEGTYLLEVREENDVFHQKIVKLQ